jgi:hypothetical protein
VVTLDVSGAAEVGSLKVGTGTTPSIGPSTGTEVSVADLLVTRGVGGAGHLTVTGNGYIGTGYIPGAGSLEVNGGITAVGNVTAGSLIRLWDSEVGDWATFQSFDGDVYLAGAAQSLHLGTITATGNAALGDSTSDTATVAGKLTVNNGIVGDWDDNQIKFCDEFFGYGTYGLGLWSPWAVFTSGGANVRADTAELPNHIGICKLYSSATSGNGAMLMQSYNGSSGAGGFNYIHNFPKARFVLIFKTGSSAANTQFKMGIIKHLTAMGAYSETRHCGLVYDPSVSTSFRFVISDDTFTSSQASTATVSADTWYKFIMTCNGANGWTFAINSETPIAISAASYTGAGNRAFGVGVWTTESSEKYLYLDLFKMTATVTR